MILFVPSVARSATTDGFDREYWMKRYLSVSYPLRSITVTSPYGKRKDPINGKVAFHSGIDLRARYKDVFAMFDGVVSETGENARAGKYVRLTHGNITVCYCHLSRIHVRKGDIVLAGDKVAVSGDTGRTTGPHLHLTGKLKGKSINPALLFAYVKSVREEAKQHLTSKENHLLPLSNSETAGLMNEHCEINEEGHSKIIFFLYHKPVCRDNNSVLPYKSH